ncbi:MAG: LuxR C-terminal-related transcriptional regulator [Pseudomonadota bacterium]
MTKVTKASVARAMLYGVGLSLAALALAWIDYQRMARTHAADLALALTAAGFLALGLFAGARLFGRSVQRPPGNPAAVTALKISGRELDVLRALAAGQANKEIARSLGVSPNTVKTHVARLYEKLDARRRTDAVARARGLGILS